MSNIAIIGSGFSGLSAAAVLSKQGHAVTVYEKNDEDIYSRSGGHALVLNGYEDGYLKIYDPWGKIYNVQFSKAKGNGIDGRTEVRHVSGSSGFVKSYSKWSKKVILNGYDYLYVHK